MNKKYCLIGLALGLAMGVLAAAPGKVLSTDYQMSVDGKNVEVVNVPKPETGIWNVRERQPYSYAPFTATGTVEVCVRSRAYDLSKTVILPQSKGVVASSQAADAVVFKLTPPMTVVLEPKGRHHALVVSANLPEANPPRKDDPKVKWFGPGFHRANRISLGDGETLYLAPGAWVEGYVLARGRDITVCGSGVLSGACWDWRKGPPESQSFNMSGTLTTFSGENLTVRDATFFSSWGWTLVFNCATNVLVDNVKVVCGRVLNDDGIDICRAKNVVLRNSFVRCQDDCITPKYWCENLVCTNMTLWTDAANAFRTGYECEPGKSGLVYRNLLFKDIDVLHLSLNKSAAANYWANCGIYIQPANDQPMYKTVYDDIRFYEVGPKDVFLNVKTRPITEGSTFCRTAEAGMLHGLTLRNIHLPDSQGGMCVNFSARDDRHPIEGVRFENVTGYGPVTKSGKVDFQTLWRPRKRLCGFNLTGMFCMTKMTEGDPRIMGYFPENRFRWMHEWGFNYARLPLDYRFFIKNGDWMQLDEEQLRKLDAAVAYGRKYGIHVNINFHRAPGYCCNVPVEPKSLFTAREPQIAFTNLWATLARRYRGIPNDELTFDLVNEPAPIYGCTRAGYAAVAKKAIAAIRAVDPERFIMSDGWLWGRKPVDELHPMTRNVGESIHVYDPHTVTHYGVHVPKNGRLGPCPPWPPKGYANGRDWLRKNFYPAWTKAENEGCFLHLGEFGTYYQCPHATALAWMEDVLAVAKEKKLGWAIWNLDGKFGLMDNGRTDCPLEDFEGHKLDRAMLTLLQRYAQD